MLKYQYGRFLHWVLPLPILVLHIILACYYFPHDVVKDERFFWPLAQYFARILGRNYFSGIESYAPPIAPLGATIHGILIHLGFGLIGLRILNSLLIYLTLVLFFHLLRKILNNDKLASFLFLVYCFNPYLHLIGSLLYSDALYLFLVVLSLYFVISEKFNFSSWICFFLLPISRQIGLFIPLGNSISSLYLAWKNQYSLKKTFLSTLFFASGLIGIATLMLYWQGPSPWKEFNLKNIQLSAQYGRFRLDYLMYYFTALGFYLFPLIFLKAKDLMQKKWICLPFILGLVLVIFFPPIKNYYHNIETLGACHTIFKTIFGKWAKIPLGILAGLFLSFFSILFHSKYVNIKLKIYFILYLSIQIQSKHIWDKYILDISMIVLLALAQDLAKIKTLKKEMSKN